MKLKELAGSLPGSCNIIGDEQVEILSVCSDSRIVRPGALFFCTPGTRIDAHHFAPQAVQNGAAALVVEHVLDLDVPQVVVENVREALSYMASRFYGDPWKRMKLIGITGTKGKTTTSFLVKSILEHSGRKAGMIGTVCSMIGDEMFPANLTTPDPIVLQDLLRRMADADCEYVVMEVSAHAVDMQRMAGVHFEVGAFTNFSQDHLDYFADMDTYFDAKLRFFTGGAVEHILYNADDERVAEAMHALYPKAMRIGISAGSDVYANDIEIEERGCRFMMSWHKKFRVPVNLRLAGIFNVYNALMAAGICIRLGLNSDQIRRGLESVRAVPGRAEVLDTGTSYRVILDYAHSPDSLENILKAVRQTTKGRMIALFGCGGDRDSAKRPLMGEIAGRLADFCVLTSDNPRSEDPMEILAQIEEGITTTGCDYVVIENRREAIRHALKMAGPGDVVILAGKGHETYQEIRGVKHPFDEKVVVDELLKELSGID